MAALVLKNLPDALHERLKAQAAANRRSLAQEAIQLLERGVLSRPVVEPLPPPIPLPGGPLRIDEIEALINEGRP
jgi:hypothetical protein